MLTPRFPEPIAKAEDAPADATKSAGRLAFPTLLSIGVIDSATRMGFLTFLPFILAAKGANLPVIGIALTLVFAGGAAGKLVCAFIGARIGVIATVCLTEALTFVLILAMLPLPLEAALADPAAARASRSTAPRRCFTDQSPIWCRPSVARARLEFSTPARSAPARSRRSSTGLPATRWA